MINRSLFSVARPRIAYPALKIDRQDLVEIPLPAKGQLLVDGWEGGAEDLRVGDRVKTGQRIGPALEGRPCVISTVTGSISGISSLTGYLGRTLTSIAFDVEENDVWDEAFGASKDTPPRKG